MASQKMISLKLRREKLLAVIEAFGQLILNPMFQSGQHKGTAFYEQFKIDYNHTIRLLRDVELRIEKDKILNASLRKEKKRAAVAAAAKVNRS